MNRLILILSMMTVLSAQNLSDYLRIAEQTDPRLRSAKLQRDADRARIAASDRLANPTLHSAIALQPVETRVGAQTLRLGISQQLPWFGTLHSRQETARAQAALQDAHYRLIRLEIRRDVQRAYLRLQIVDRKLSEYGALRKVIKSLITTVQSDVRSGDRSDDLRHAQNRLDRLEIEMHHLDQHRPHLIRHFNRLLGRPDTLAVQVTALSDQPAITGTTIHPQHPERQIYALGTKHKLAQRNQVTKEQNPQIQLGLDYLNISARDDLNAANNGADAWFFNVSVTLPIHSQSDAADRQSANLRYQAAIADAQDGERQLLLSYDSLVTDWHNHLAAISHLNQVIRRLTAMHDDERTRSGQLNTRLERLLDAEMRLLETRIERLDHLDQLHQIAIMLNFYHDGGFEE